MSTLVLLNFLARLHCFVRKRLKKVPPPPGSKVNIFIFVSVAPAGFSLKYLGQPLVAIRN